MPKGRPMTFSTLWSIFTWTPDVDDDDISPLEEGPRLVYIRKSCDTTVRVSPSSSVTTPSQDEISDSSFDTTSQSTTRRKPTRQRLKELVSCFASSQRKIINSSDIESCRFHRRCLLCREEIDHHLRYASESRIAQYDDTYISTKCCRNHVHSSCYRITLQYFIDSKGRPRCPICRAYPDHFVACWALGYIFDKDVGDIDNDECYCPAGVVCEVCEGRKQLLQDLHMSDLGIEKGPRVQERLWTIEEDEEETYQRNL